MNAILELFLILFINRYPSLRVAYIDEVEETSKDRSKNNQKVYYSTLVKAALPKTNSSDPGQNLDQVICDITFVSAKSDSSKVRRRDLFKQNVS